MARRKGYHAKRAKAARRGARKGYGRGRRVSVSLPPELAALAAALHTYSKKPASAAAHTAAERKMVALLRSVEAEKKRAAKVKARKAEDDDWFKKAKSALGIEDEGSNPGWAASDPRRKRRSKKHAAKKRSKKRSHARHGAGSYRALVKRHGVKLAARMWRAKGKKHHAKKRSTKRRSHRRDW